MITCQIDTRKKKRLVSFNSFHLNKPSNSLNYYPKSNSKSINFTKILKVLQLASTSFGQFSLAKINFFKSFDYKRHLLELVTIPTREKIDSISI